ncbi:uncharacterized protein LOC5517325 [Nematostella vectensis]|nr:uncharacterized protein LOC5517325 [Nematostella vectensis]
MRVLYILAVLAFAYTQTSTSFKWPLTLLTDLNKEDTLLDGMQSDDPQADVEKRASDPSESCEYGHKSDVVIDDSSKKILFDSDFSRYYSENDCAPRPVVVILNTPPHVTAIPQYTTLHRCMGITLLGRHQQCVASRMEKLSVQYYDGVTYESHYAVMYNHTKCESQCTKKASDCNANEAFENCLCTCQTSQLNCNTTYQHVDPANCRCNCLVQENCGIYREWNRDTCKCECASCLRNICVKANKNFDEEHCACVE